MAVPGPLPYAGIPNIIYVTDANTDANDVHCTVMALIWHRLRYINLKAVIINGSTDGAAPAHRAILDYYGFQDTPIGCYKGNETETGQVIFRDNYTRDYFRPGDTRMNYPDSLPVFRQALADCDDGTVIIVSGGFAIDLHELMLSPADEISPLTGMELITSKVNRMTIVAGWFPDRATLEATPEWPQIGGGLNPGQGYLVEFNIGRGPLASFKYLAENWPNSVPLIWFGADAPRYYAPDEVNAVFPTSDAVMPRLLNPAKYFEWYTFGFPIGRPIWEEMMLLNIRFGDTLYTQYMGQGYVTLDAQGQSTFNNHKNYNQWWVRVNGEKAVIESYVNQFMIEPINQVYPFTKQGTPSQFFF